MLSLLLVVSISALASLSTGLPGSSWSWSVALEQKLDGCPYKIQLGGKVTRASRIASEIFPRSEYDAWVKAGRPARFAKMSAGASKASVGNVTSPKLINSFSFNSKKNVPGDFNVLLYSSGDPVVEPERKDIARGQCPANADISDYGNNGRPKRMRYERKQKEGSSRSYQGNDSSSVTSAVRVIHGEVVQKMELAAYNVKITRLNPHRHIQVESCSGSLIAPQYVVTAGHCNVTVGEHVFIGDT